MKAVFKIMICAVLVSLAVAGAVAQCVSDNEQDVNKPSRHEYRIGDSFELHGVRHGSVGMDCALEYDTAAFAVKTSCSYDHPLRRNMCGGDRQTVTYTVICKKCGAFVIREIENFRGEKSIKAEHAILVRN